MRVLVATVIYPTAQRPVSGTFVRTQVEALRALGVDVDVVVFSGRTRKLAYPAGVVEVNRRLRRGGYDLVHAHYGFVGIAARLQRRRPLVVSYHGSDLLGRMTHGGRISWPSRLEARGSRALARVIDGAIVQSEEMRARLDGRTRVFLIPHEVDLARFRPMDRADARARLGLDPDRRYLLFAANPAIPTKGFPFARRVADELARRDPGTELLVVWREPQERLPLWMNAADALVFPSFQEGSPNVVKQAMACNLPLVATAVGDVPERTAGARGCHVLERSVPAFADALEEILARGERADARRLVAHLDAPLVARRVLEAYQTVLDAA
jgi:glycosyltransferase involved in cell wall biosynthesis